MIKKTIYLLFAFAIASVSFTGIAPAQAIDAKTQKAREFVQKAGTGPNARVEAKLVDDRKVKGYIGSVSADSFEVVDAKTGDTQTIRFNEVDSIKKPRNGLKPRTWVIIGAAAAAAIIVGKTVLYPVLCDGGAGC